MNFGQMNLNMFLIFSALIFSLVSCGGDSNGGSSIENENRTQIENQTPSEEQTHTEFKGNIKNSDEICSLHIERIFYEGAEAPENLRAEVVVEVVEEHGQGDEHDSEEDREEFKFIVAPGNRPNLFSGTRANGRDRLNIITSSSDLETVESYALKWMHINHYHSAQCMNLLPD